MKEKIIEVLLSKQDTMWKRAMYLCKNMADAEDLVSDSNLKILAMIEKGTFADEKAFGEYFALAVNNLFIDKIRKQKRSPIEFKSETIYLQQPIYAKDYISNEIQLSEIMQRANIELSMQPIFEVFLSGVNIKHYAKKNGLNINTVRSYIHRIKHYLNRNKHLFEDLRDGFDLITAEDVLPTNKKLSRV